MNDILSTKAQLVISWICLVVALVGWPVSALTWARDEPAFILGLSWLALVLTSYGNIVSAQVNKEVSVKRGS